ncbi:MAG: ThuA domain-containing protein [Micrococcales bacterium]|nr:ThuA domain-containing protein [Micrococcales bacterium]
MSRKALVVRGGWEGHQPVEATELFLPFLRENGFEVRVEESTAVYADADELAATDLIMQLVTMSTIQREEVDGLIAAVANGTGMAGWHGGIADSFRDSDRYLHFMGGQFASHPGRHPSRLRGEQEDNYRPHRIELTDLGREHPITEGIEDFELTTEQYWVLHDDYLDVLATTTQAVREWDPWQRPVTSPAIWTRQWGKGRIFVSTPGHRVEILEHPAVRTIIERGLLWAARGGAAS